MKVSENGNLIEGRCQFALCSPKLVGHIIHLANYSFGTLAYDQIALLIIHHRHHRLSDGFQGAFVDDIHIILMGVPMITETPIGF